MEKSKVIRSAGLIGSFTMVSRGLGLVRDILMAFYFGTGLAMSAFVIAFTIPNLFRRLFGEGALSSAFIPVFVRSRERDGDASAWSLAQKVISLAIVVLAVIVILGVLLISLVLGQPLGEKTAVILPLLRIMLPYMMFICLAALSMAILNSFHHFAVPAATPCLLNLIWIGAVVLVCPHLGPDPADRIVGVAWAVLLAGLVQLLVQLPVLRRFGYRSGWSLDLKDERVARVLKLMGPAALGMAVTQINVMIDRLLAIWVGGYGPSALYYSERLIYFPLGIFATALGTVLLPVFSRQAARANVDELKSTLQHALRNLFFVMVPASVGLLVLARPIVEMLFESGEFTHASTDLTTIALQFYAPGLLVFSLAKVMVPAFYAQEDTRTPVKVGLFTVALNLGLNLLFVLTWPQHLKHAGLACATVIAEAVYALILASILRRRIGSLGWPALVRSFFKTGVNAALMGAAAVGVWHLVEPWVSTFGMPVKAALIVSVLLTITMAGLVYLVLASLSKSPELKEILHAVLRRKKRGDE